jgi:hypothetical protein
MKKILEKSSLPGIPKIIENDHFAIKFIWLMCLICLTSISMYYVILNVVSYLSYSVNTNIELINEQQSIQFPTVSFCFTFETDNNNNNQTNDDNTLLQCTFNLQQCNLLNDFELVTFNYFNNLSTKCYRFNSGYNLFKNESTKIKHLTRTDSTTGLVLILNLKEYIYSLITGSLLPFKIQIFIQNYTTIFDLFQPYFINSGSLFINGVNYIEIEKEIIQKLSKPYNDCIKQETLSYTQNDCINICIKNIIINNCSTIATNNSNCIYDNYISFINGSNIIPNECVEKCPIECDLINYKINKYFLGTIPQEYLNDVNLSTNLSDSLIYMCIYYPNKYYKLISQSSKMQLFDLISSVGGVISLFIGFSFLTLVELIDVLFKYLYYFIFNRNRNKIEII